MGFTRGPQIVTNNLILLADPSNIKSTGGSVNMSDMLGNYTNSVTDVSEMSIISSPSFLKNTGDGGLLRYNAIAEDVNWATTNFSFCTWGKRIDYVNSKQGRIFDLLKAANGHLRLTLETIPTFGFRPTAGATTTLVAGGTTDPGNWYNITVTKKGEVSGGSAVYSLYLNGKLVGTNTTSTLITDSNFTYIQTMNSNDDDDNSITWNGDFGPFLLYNSVLTPLEVLKNYNAIKSRFELE